MTPNEYQELAIRTASKKTMSTTDHMINTGALGLTGEAGEVSDLVKKYLYHGHTLEFDKVKKELGDVLWYVALTAKAIGVPLEDVMIANIEKLKKRYPDGFEVEKSLHRQEGDI